MSESIDPRVLQANERTLLAWIRTGVALMGFGFAIERLAVWFATKHNVRDQTVTVAIGVGMVGLGTLAEMFGALRFIAVKRALVEGRAPPSKTEGPVLLAMLVAVAGLALFVYLLSG